PSRSASDPAGSRCHRTARAFTCRIRRRTRPSSSIPHKGRRTLPRRSGARLYLSDQTTNSLIVVDTAKRAEIARAKLGDSPEAIYVSPDGRFLSAAIEENNQVLIVDTASLAPVKNIKMRGRNPEHAVWSPDGKWLYASAEEA